MGKQTVDTLEDKKSLRDVSLRLLVQSESDEADWPEINQLALELGFLARAKLGARKSVQDGFQLCR